MSHDTMVKNLLKAFSEKFNNSEFFTFANVEEYQAQKVKESNEWPWAESYGVYYFHNDSGFLYVGRALSSTFGKRIDEHLKTESGKWKNWPQEINNPSTMISFIHAEGEDWYMAAALEIWLITHLNPLYNEQFSEKTNLK